MKLTVTIPAHHTVTLTDPLTGALIASFDVLTRTALRFNGYRISYEPCGSGKRRPDKPGSSRDAAGRWAS